MFSLYQPDIYLEQLERLRTKAKRRRRHTPQGHLPHSEIHRSTTPRSTFPIAAVNGREIELCRRLALEVRAGDYHFSALSRVTIWTDDKQRIIHRPGLLDALVLGAMSQRLTTLLEGVLDDRVHAYRPGRNQQRTIARVCGYLAQHRNARANPRERGLFVLQRDLSAYGESIPTHEDSELWSLLKGLLGTMPDQSEARALWALLESACRPEVRLNTGEIVVMQHGLPTGSPIQQPLANLYLAPLDRAVQEVNPEFYARFGDDLLVLDCDPHRASATATVLNDVTGRLGVSWNQKKTHDWYFTLPGRPFDGATATPFTPTSHIEYLGARLSFRGRLGLKRKRLRQLLQRSRWRIENTLAIASKEDAVELVSQVLQQTLTQPGSLADPSAEALHTWVDDRDQLRQLDRHLAQLCAEALSGVRGVRAFRHVPPRLLRASGFGSMLQLRRRSEETT